MNIYTLKFKTSLLFGLLTLCFQGAVFAQKPVIVWKNNSAEAKLPSYTPGVVQDHDGNILEWHSPVSNYVALRKFDVATGALIWSKNFLQSTLSGASERSFIKQLLLLPDGGYLMVGYTSAQGLSGVTPRGDLDGFILKADSEFNIVWHKVIGGSGVDHVNSIYPLKEGGYAIAGTTNSYDGDWTPADSLGKQDIFVMKLDNTGNTILWQKRYGGSGADLLKGGSLTQQSSMIQQDTINGGFIIAANTDSNDGHIIAGGNTRKNTYTYPLDLTTTIVNPHPGMPDTWVFKINDTGDLQWSKCYGGTMPQESRGVLVTPEGHYLFNIATLSQDGDVSYPKGGGIKRDIWLVWADKNGNIIREKSYGGEDNDNCTIMTPHKSGGYLLMGETASRMFDVDDNTFPVGSYGPDHPWIAKIDTAGTVEWTKFVLYDGGPSNFNNGSLLLDNGEIVVGTDRWTVKLSACPADLKLEKEICYGDTLHFNGKHYTEDGVYLDTVQGFCPNYVELTLIVNPLPAVPNITGNGNTLSTEAGFASYTWTVNDQPIPYAQNKTSFVAEEGSGNYQLIVTNAKGCQNQAISYAFAYDGCQAPATEWAKSYGGGSAEQARSVTAMPDGYLIIGSTNAGIATGDVKAAVNGELSNDVWLIKISHTGDTLWTKKPMGGNGADVGIAVRATADGGFIFVAESATNAAAGDITAPRPVASSGTDIWVVKFTAAATVEWQQLYGGSGTDNVYSVEPTTDGGYVISAAAAHAATPNGTHTGSTPNGGVDGWILKLKTDGTLDWQKRLGGGGADHLHSIKQTSDGGYIAVGYSAYNATAGTLGETPRPITGAGGNDVWVIKLDASGETQWQKLYGGSGADMAYSVKQTAEGGYIVSGYAAATSTNGTLDGITKPGGNDFWILKLDNNGTIQWQKALGGTGSDQAVSQDIVVETDGYVFAGLSNSLNGDVSISNGGNDYWVVKTDLNGNLLWQKSLGGTAADQANAITVANDGGYIVAGQASAGGIANAKGGVDFYIVKLNDCQTCTIPTYTSICEGDSYDFNGTDVTTAGIYQDITDVNGCQSIQALALNLNPVYTTSLAHSICDGDSYDFYGTVLSEADTYYEVLTSSKGCDSTIALTLSLNALPTPSITTNGSELSTGAFSSYQWLLDDVEIEGATSQTFLATESGSYRVVVSGANTCSDTSAVFAFTATGIWNSTGAYGVSLHPNPVSSELHVSLASNSTSAEVFVTSMDGREVLHQLFSGSDVVLDVSSLTQGLYIVKVFENGALKSVQKIIKK